MKPSNYKVLANCLFAATLYIGPTATADFPIDYGDCDAITENDFQTTYLLTHSSDGESRRNGAVKHESLRSLIRFDLLKNGDDFDIFYGGFEGVLYRYNSQNKEVTTIKDFNTIQGSVGSAYNSGDHGLTGIAFHPDFEMNRWLFVFYSPKRDGDENRIMHISRFEMNENYQLENEKILMVLEATTTDKWHSGGDMNFNAQGDLYIQVGDNVANDSRNDSKPGNAAWTSANTTNLLGGIIRIHPDNSERGYAIPKDNFGEYFARTENNADYMDPNRVMPEIFAKGQRSNWSATTHPVENIHIWGEVCTGGGHDEINIVQNPIYGGWPHFQGNAEYGRSGGSNSRYSHDLDDTPTLSNEVAGNLVSSDAIQELPKVYPADIVVRGEFNVVMAQALYYYGQAEFIWEGRTFPPNFHETFIIANAKGNPGDTRSRILPLVREGSTVTAELKDNSYTAAGLLTDQNDVFHYMTEAKYGPDGALYVMARNGFYGDPKGFISRIDYTGDCQDPTLFSENQQKIITAAATKSDPNRYRENYSISLSDAYFGPKFTPGQKLNVQVHNVMGRRVATYSTTASLSGTVGKWDKKMETSIAPEGVYFIQYYQDGQLIYKTKQVF